MKKILIISCFIFVALFSEAQSWNPYVSQGIMSSLLPGEFNGTGEASFNVGNTGSTPIMFDKVNPEKNLKVVIQLSEGVPDEKNPVDAIQGSWASFFEWSYDAGSETYTGIQKTEIPGYQQGSISVGYKVMSNSSANVVKNGFTISLISPSYMKNSNTTQDDMVSSYTFTRAYDFGDAPESYGIARHEINFAKNENGKYTNYILLGKTVDPEPEYLGSEFAKGDDINGKNDEDGVIIPPLWPGTTAIIPVTVTVIDESFGVLNAWFDWNGDGDFADKGERITETPISVLASDTYMITVNVPDSAITTRPTFARFRVGANSSYAGNNLRGEVEDYQVIIQSLDIHTALTQENVLVNGESSGSINLTVSGGIPSYTYLWSSGQTTEDIFNLLVGNYTVIIKDSKNATTITSTTITQPGVITSYDLLNSEKGWNIMVYPNPIIDNYYVAISNEGSYKLELMDISGKIIFNTTTEVNSAKGRTIQLSKGNLVTGQYILRITNKKEKESKTVKLIMIDQR